MATCPNCGKKLRLIDWRPECPECKVNLNYYKANERLLEDSEKVEIEHAKSQPRTDRVKYATVGNKDSIIRLVLFIIPLVSLFLPIFFISVSGHKKGYNAIDIYNLVSAIDIGKVLGNITPLIIGVVLIALPAVLGIVFAVLQITSGTEKGLKRNIVFSCVSIALVIASLICTFIFAGSPKNDYYNFVLNEAESALNVKSQSTVDGAVQKIRNFLGDTTVDTALLERAIAEGDKALAEAKIRFYSDDTVAELNKALDEAKAAIAKTDITIDDVRNFAAAIMTQVNTFEPIKETDVKVNYLGNEEFEVKDIDITKFQKEDYKVTYSNIDGLKAAYAYASAITNDDGIYSEKSFEALAGEKPEEGQDPAEVSKGKNGEIKELIDKIDAGEPIVNIMQGDNVTPKEPDAIETETANKITETLVGYKNTINALTDESVLTPLCEKFAAEKDALIAAADIKASIGFAGFVYLVFLIAQLINNIRLKKKGIHVTYTQCLIGGLPSEEYFELKAQGVSEEEIHRKMLKALAVLQEEAETTLSEEEAAEK